MEVWFVNGLEDMTAVNENKTWPEHGKESTRVVPAHGFTGTSGICWPDKVAHERRQRLTLLACAGGFVAGAAHAHARVGDSQKVVAAAHPIVANVNRGAERV